MVVRTRPVPGRIRRVRTVAVCLATVLAGVTALAVAPSSEANSIWTSENNFEGVNSGPVSFEHVGDGNGFMVLDDQPHAQTFRGYAVIVTTPGNWSAVRTYIGIMPSGLCNLGVWVNPVNHTETLNVEVIDPVTWTYTALKTVRLSGNTWQKVSMSFRASAAAREDQVFRVSVVNPVLPAPAQTPAYALAHVDSFHNECAD
jgi:hypothetical protein